jgi:hypothetical protein
VLLIGSARRGLGRPLFPLSQSLCPCTLPRNVEASHANASDPLSLGQVSLGQASTLPSGISRFHLANGRPSQSVKQVRHTKKKDGDLTPSFSVSENTHCQNEMRAFSWNARGPIEVEVMAEELVGTSCPLLFAAKLTPVFGLSKLG